MHSVPSTAADKPTPWGVWFCLLVVVHAVGIGAWYGSQHPFPASRPKQTADASLNWQSPADFLGEAWPEPRQPTAPLQSSVASPPVPPVVKGGAIVIRRLSNLSAPQPPPTNTPPSGQDLQRALDDYDLLIKHKIEEQWTPPKGDSSRPVQIKLRISVGGIIQNSGITQKSALVELNRGATDLLEKLERTGKPLPDGITSEYEIEVELHATE